MWTLEVLRSCSAITAEKSRDRPVGIDLDQKDATPCEKPPERSCEPDELIDVSAVGKDRTGNAKSLNREKHKWLTTSATMTDQADAAVIRVCREKLPLQRLEAGIIISCRAEWSDARATQAARQQGYRNEVTVAVAPITLHLKNRPGPGHCSNIGI